MSVEEPSTRGKPEGSFLRALLGEGCPPQPRNQSAKDTDPPGPQADGQERRRGRGGGPGAARGTLGAESGLAAAPRGACGVAACALAAGAGAAALAGGRLGAFRSPAQRSGRGGRQGRGGRNGLRWREGPCRPLLPEVGRAWRRFQTWSPGFVVKASEAPALRRLVPGQERPPAAVGRGRPAGRRRKGRADMASRGRWERLRPLLPDTMHVSEVHSRRGREVVPVDGERARRRRNALLPSREVLGRFPKVLPLGCSAGGGSPSWKAVAGLPRVVHERDAVAHPSHTAF